MLLFKVDDIFLITGRGLVLMLGIGNNNARVGDKIRIIKPDNSILEATIKGIGFSATREILVGSDLSKDDIPIGSEVWLQ